MRALPLSTPPLCVKPSPLSFPNPARLTLDIPSMPPLSPLFTTLTAHSQATENKATLSPFPATLAGHVKHKSFVCHSYKKHRGVGASVFFFARHSPRVTSATHSNARISNSLRHLLHNSLDTRGGGVCLRHQPSDRRPTLERTHFYRCPICPPLPLTFNFQLSTLSTSHESPITSHRTRVTEHGSPITSP